MFPLLNCWMFVSVWNVVPPNMFLENGSHTDHSSWQLKGDCPSSMISSAVICSLLLGGPTTPTRDWITGYLWGFASGFARCTNNCFFVQPSKTFGIYIFLGDCIGDIVWIRCFLLNILFAKWQAYINSPICGSDLSSRRTAGFFQRQPVVSSRFNWLWVNIKHLFCRDILTTDDSWPVGCGSSS